MTPSAVEVMHGAGSQGSHLFLMWRINTHQLAIQGHKIPRLCGGLQIENDNELKGGRGPWELGVGVDIVKTPEMGKNKAS